MTFLCCLHRLTMQQMTIMSLTGVEWLTRELKISSDIKNCYCHQIVAFCFRGHLVTADKKCFTGSRHPQLRWEVLQKNTSIESSLLTIKLIPRYLFYFTKRTVTGQSQKHSKTAKAGLHRISLVHFWLSTQHRSRTSLARVCLPQCLPVLLKTMERPVE